MEENKFSIAGIWNESLEKGKYEIKSRNYISASDIGKSMLDRWLKMKGTPETNPYDTRVLRIFAAGNEFHHLIRKVFEKIGLIIDAERYSEIPENEKHLKILGYYDLKLGGKVNVEEAEKRIREYGFSEFIESKALFLLHYFAEKYPNGLNQVIAEVKSVNSNAFWSKKDYLSEAYPWHILQLYTYLKALNIPEGKLLYISKDDLSLVEHSVLYPTNSLEDRWNEDVEKITVHYLENTEPKAEPNIVFNQRKGKAGLWEVNWMLARSPYLTKITGLSSTDWEKKAKEAMKAKNKK